MESNKRFSYLDELDQGRLLLEKEQLEEEIEELKRLIITSQNYSEKADAENDIKYSKEKLEYIKELISRKDIKSLELSNTID